MSQKGKVQLAFVITAPPDQVAVNRLGFVRELVS